MHEEKQAVDVDLAFTDAEMTSLSNQMTDSVFEIRRIKEEKKAMDAILNEQIKTEELSLQRVAEMHRDGKRVVAVMCALTLNHEAQQREWVAVDDKFAFAAGQIVKTEPFRPQDNQVALPFAEPEMTVVDENYDPFADPEPVAEEPDVEVEEFNEAFQSLSGDVETAIEDGLLTAASVRTEETPDEDPSVDDDPFGGEDPFASEEEDPKEIVVEVSDKGAELSGVKPPPFDLTPAHAKVLRATRDVTGTDPLSFAGEDKSVRAAAEHLIGMKYIDGTEHDNIVALTKAGEDLFTAGFVP